MRADRAVKWQEKEEKKNKEWSLLRRGHAFKILMGSYSNFGCLDNVSLEMAKGYKCLVLLGNKVLDADMRWFFGVTDDVAGTFFTD